MCYHSDLADIQPQLLSFIRGRVINESDANDVMQESNRVLITKEEDYNPKYPFKSWALGIAKWQVLAYFKRCKRAVPLLSLDISEELNPNWLSDVPFASLIKKERAEMINNLNHVLSKRQKQVFNLLVQGFTNVEIANTIGTTRSNVQSTKSRLIERIRNFVTDNKNESYYKY